MSDLRIAFAGDRDVAAWVLEFMLREQVHPLALLVPEAPRASHADELVALCSFLEPHKVLWGAPIPAAGRSFIAAPARSGLYHRCALSLHHS